MIQVRDEACAQCPYFEDGCLLSGSPESACPVVRRFALPRRQITELRPAPVAETVDQMGLRPGKIEY